MGERNDTPEERRSIGRSALSTTAHVSAVPEQPLPAATTVDISAAGVLLAFPEPVGLEPTDRVVVSLRLPDGRLHSLGTVQRVDRGTDYRTYVAVTFEQLSDDDRRRLSDALAAEPAEDAFGD